MKKFADQLAAIPEADLAKTATDLRSEIANLKRGVKLGEVQNYQVIQIKKRLLARVLTRLSAPKKEAK